MSEKITMEEMKILATIIIKNTKVFKTHRGSLALAWLYHILNEKRLGEDVTPESLLAYMLEVDMDRQKRWFMYTPSNLQTIYDTDYSKMWSQVCCIIIWLMKEVQAIKNKQAKQSTLFTA